MIRFLIGTETYLIRKELERLLSGRTYSVYEEMSQEALDDAFQTSLMGGRNAILIRAKKLADNKALLSYLKSPRNATDLFVVTGSIDKRSVLHRHVTSNGMVIDCSKVKEEGLWKHIMRFLKANHMRMTEAAYHALVVRSEYFVRDEVTLDALFLFLRQLSFTSLDVTEDAVLLTLPRPCNQKAFDLYNALLKHDFNNLFRLAEQLLANGENAIGMMSLLLRPLRLSFKASLFDGIRTGLIADELGVSPFQLTNFPMSTRQLEDAMSFLNDGIAMIKSGDCPPRVSFLYTLGRLASAFEQCS